MPSPDRRPQPVWLKAPPAKRRPPGPGKSRPPRRPRSRRSGAQTGSNAPYWIAGALLLLLVGFIALYIETPEIKAWLFPPANSSTVDAAASAFPKEPLPQNPLPPAPAPKVKTAMEEDRVKKAKLKLDEARQLKIAHEQAARLPPAPAILVKPAPIVPAPPLVENAPVAPPTLPPASGTPPKEETPPSSQVLPLKPGTSARALPLDMNKLDTERIAAYQVSLERLHFSCGFIDGDQGMRTQRMLRAYQISHGLPVTGFLDQPTRDAIGEPGDPFLTYTVTQRDVDSIMPRPSSWVAKSKASRLGYNEIWEMLAEKFHCTRAYLKGLNREVSTPVAGTEIVGPKVYPAAPIPKAASLRIILSETSIEALDANGRIIAFFPCSIAKDKNKRPHGLLTVKVVDPNPDYTFDPALFVDASKSEGITHKIVLPPGPRNPVGTTWVGLSLPGYGIHGTPEPENISRTQSHGCFRLANWNAEKVLKMVHVGTPVDVQP